MLQSNPQASTLHGAVSETERVWGREVHYSVLRYSPPYDIYHHTLQADFGKKVTATVSRNGDLIHRTYLRVEVPSVSVPAASSSSSYKGFRWLNWLGHILIKNVEIEINDHHGLKKHLASMISCKA